eukprot:gene6094-7592_t
MIINGISKKNEILFNSFSKIGCLQIVKISPGWNYCAIGYKGQSIGTAKESLRTLAASVSNSNSIDTVFNAASKSISVKYEMSSPKLNPKIRLDYRISIYGLRNGMNVITFPENWNSRNYKLVNFDTSDENKLVKIDFAKYIESIEDDTLVLIVTQGNAKLKLGDEGLYSIASLGSNFIYQYVNIPQNNKWFILTRKSNRVPYCESTSSDSLTGEFSKVLFDHPIPDIQFFQKSMAFAYRTSQYLGDKDIIVSIISGNLKNYPTFNNYVIVNDFIVSTDKNKWGILMVSISEVNGMVYDKKFYDLTPEKQKEMVMDIYGLSIGTITLVTFYETNNIDFKGISDELAFAFETLGSQSFNLLNPSSSYALIGRKGSPAGSCPEMLSNDGPVSISHCFNPQNRVVKPFIDISSVSRAVDDSYHPGYSKFYINSILVEFKSKNGLNIITINPTNGAIYNCYTYSIFDDFTQVKACIEELIGLQIGTIVALSFMYLPRTEIPETLKDTIRDYLGAKQIHDYFTNNSYCLISVVGKDIPHGQRIISECISIGNIETSCQLRFPIRSLFSLPEGYSICCTSKGSGTIGSSNGNCEIMVNGVLLNEKKDGLNVMFIDPKKDFNNSIVEKHYNTLVDEKEWIKFSNDLESYNNGSIVAISIKKSIGVISMDEAKFLQKVSLSSIGACKFLSVPKTGSYSIIGIKGSPPGSANEAISDGNSQVCVSLWEPKASQKPKLNQVENQVDPPFGMSNDSQVITSVPILNHYYQLSAPNSLINNSTPAPMGNIFKAEPAWMVPTSVPSPFPNGRVVKALLIGTSYGYTNGYVKDVKSHITNHAQALVQSGYVENQNIRMLIEGLTEISNSSSDSNDYVCGPSFVCIQNEINNWLVKDLKEGDSIYLMFSGRSYQKNSPAGPQYGLCTLTSDFSNTDYSFTSSTLKNLLFSVPYGVNITILLDCSYAYEIFLPLGTSTKALGILAVETGDKVLPVNTQLSIGFLPAITQVLSSYYKKHGKSPTQTYDDILKEVKLIRNYTPVPFISGGCLQIVKISPGWNYCAIGYKGQSIGTAKESVSSLAASVSTSNSSFFYSDGNSISVKYEKLSQKLVDPTIQNLGKDTIFMLATKGNVKFKMDQMSISYIKSLGSNFIDEYLNNQSDNDKWFMVTKKGAINPYCEYTSSNSITAEYHFTVPQTLEATPPTSTSKVIKLQNETMEEITVSVVSDSNICNSNRIIVNDRIFTTSTMTTIINGDCRGFGILMVNIDELNGTVYQSRFYNLESPDTINTMVSDIYNLSIGTISVLCSYPSLKQICTFQGVSNELSYALMSLGSKFNNSIKHTSSYALIGRKGSPSASCPELISDDGPVSLSNSFDFSNRFTKPFIDILSVSRALNQGEPGYSNFFINSIPIDFNYSNGINILTINSDNGLINGECMNYNIFNDESEIQSFIEYIISIPVGTIVVISFMGSSPNQLPKAIEDTIIKYLGAKHFNNYSTFKSYCIIAEVGLSLASRRITSESISPDVTESICQLRLPFRSLFTATQDNTAGYTIYCESKGSGDRKDSSYGNCEIIVNGRHLQHKSDGLNVVFVDPHTNNILEKQYNTILDEKQWRLFFDDVTSIQNGTIVIVSIKKSIGSIKTDEMKNLQRISLSTIGACKFLSVPQYGSYSIIGIKGASPGSANELYKDGKSQVCVSQWEPPPPPPQSEESSTTFGIATQSQLITYVPLLNYYHKKL